MAAEIQQLSTRKSEKVMWENSSYTTDLILVIVDDLNSAKERIKLSEEQGSVLNHSDIASVCIYLALEEAQ